MNNVEQIRASAALDIASGLNRSYVRRIPSMLITNGLIATIGFVIAKDSDPNYQAIGKAFVRLGEHLADRKILESKPSTLEDLVRKLCQCETVGLQRATAEALQFFGHLKRFSTDKD